MITAPLWTIIAHLLEPELYQNLSCLLPASLVRDEQYYRSLVGQSALALSLHNHFSWKQLFNSRLVTLDGIHNPPGVIFLLISGMLAWDQHERLWIVLPRQPPILFPPSLPVRQVVDSFPVIVDQTVIGLILYLTPNNELCLLLLSRDSYHHFYLVREVLEASLGPIDEGSVLLLTTTYQVVDLSGLLPWELIVLLARRLVYGRTQMGWGLYVLGMPEDDQAIMEDVIQVAYLSQDQFYLLTREGNLYIYHDKRECWVCSYRGVKLIYVERPHLVVVTARKAFRIGPSFERINYPTIIAHQIPFYLEQNQLWDHCRYSEACIQF